MIFPAPRPSERMEPRQILESTSSDLFENPRKETIFESRESHPVL